MTAIRRRGGSRSSANFGKPLLEFQEELGPIARWGGQFTLAMAIVFLFQAAGPYIPNPMAYLIMIGGLSVLLLAPGRVTLRMPVSISVLLMVGWIAASLTWSDSPASTQLVLLRAVPTLIGVILIVGLMDARHIGASLLWAVRGVVLLSLIVTVTMPSTRIHLDSQTGEPSLDGWHALFPHKNIMAPFLVFAIPTILTFDRTVLIKIGTLTGIGVLLIGSDSVTGWASAVLVFGIWVWLQFFKNLDVRNSSVFTVASVVFGIFTVGAAAASLADIVDASGKDVTFSGRTFIWQATINAILDQPFVGFGFGGVFGFDPITPRTAAIWRDVGFTVPHAHNGILDVILQLGLVGAGIYLLLWFSVLIGSVRMLNRQPQIAEWILSVVLGQFFISLSENVFLGAGWLAIIIMFRLLLLRKRGLSLDIAERPARERTPLQAAVVGVGQQIIGNPSSDAPAWSAGSETNGNGGRGPRNGGGNAPGRGTGPR
ncbi:MAG: O-antigen ligase family protein [Actinomycetota bacterium]